MASGVVYLVNFRDGSQPGFNRLGEAEPVKGRRLPVVDDDNTLVGSLAQADVAFLAKEKAVGEMVEEISKPPTVHACSHRRVDRSV